jgi:RNA polymerase sigma-70 factor (ECF subfamily)
MPFSEDNIWVFYLKQGNTKAFEQLFLKYQKKLYYFGYKILKNKEEAENLVQAVFMDVWENREQINEEKSFSGYIFKIAKNKISNLLRKKINEQMYFDYITEQKSNNEELKTDELISQQFEEIFDKLINSLPERRKEIFLLSRNDGLTYKEIALKLNISENTVDTQIRNALDYLRERYNALKKES